MGREPRATVTRVTPAGRGLRGWPRDRPHAHDLGRAAMGCVRLAPAVRVHLEPVPLPHPLRPDTRSCAACQLPCSYERERVVAPCLPPPRPTPRGATSSPCPPDSPPGLRLTTLTLLKALVGCLSSVPQTVSGACHQCPGGDARGGHPGMGVCREVSTLGPRPWMPGALQVLSARRPWFHVVSTSTFPPSSWVSSLRAAPLPSSPTGSLFVYVSGPRKFTSPCGSRCGHAIIHLVGQTVWLRSPGAPPATRLYVELSPVVPGLGSGFI